MKKELGADIKKLGFGLMRLPTKGEEIELEELKAMVDHFLSNGFTYFDTAYVYHGGMSEVAAREALVKRHPRESFQLATKLPIWAVKEKADLQKIVDTQLERTGAGYFDFYLLHSLDKPRLKVLDEFGAWDFLKSLKDRGIARHIGFSFHDKADVLDELLTAHPEAEFVQLQINYVDWDSPSVQSRACYEVARRHGKSVVIMEPVKGGALAVLSPAVQKVLQDANPNASLASWALRFAASLEGVITVLSGMSNLSQIEDNVATMSHFQPLGQEEYAVIDRVNAMLKAIPTVPCTSCRYCVDGCPQSIVIPSILGNYNDYLLYNNLPGAKRSYGFSTRDHGKASDCIACGACEGVCPQHIEIIETLKKAAGLFE